MSNPCSCGSTEVFVVDHVTTPNTEYVNTVNPLAIVSAWVQKEKQDSLNLVVSAFPANSLRRCVRVAAAWSGLPRFGAAGELCGSGYRIGLLSGTLALDGDYAISAGRFCKVEASICKGQQCST